MPSDLRSCMPFLHCLSLPRSSARKLVLCVPDSSLIAEPGRARQDCWPRVHACMQVCTLADQLPLDSGFTLTYKSQNLGTAGDTFKDTLTQPLQCSLLDATPCSGSCSCCLQCTQGVNCNMIDLRRDTHHLAAFLLRSNNSSCYWSATLIGLSKQ